MSDPTPGLRLTKPAGAVVQTQADKYKYIIIAPDSRTSAFTGWSVPSAEEPPSADMLHTQVRFRAKAHHSGVYCECVRAWEGGFR